MLAYLSRLLADSTSMVKVCSRACNSRGTGTPSRQSSKVPGSVRTEHVRLARKSIANPVATSMCQETPMRRRPLPSGLTLCRSNTPPASSVNRLVFVIFGSALDGLALHRNPAQKHKYLARPANYRSTSEDQRARNSVTDRQSKPMPWGRVMFQQTDCLQA
jgi:hypothetical protein